MLASPAPIADTRHPTPDTKAYPYGTNRHERSDPGRGDVSSLGLG
jgi:hypothetical protein